MICAGCSVRVQCLHSSLEPPALSPVTPGREWGIRGGTDHWDRAQTRGLPRGECAALLESTFPERLRIRTEAWRAALWHRVESGGAISKRDRRVGAILAEDMPERKHKLRKRKVGRFTLGGQPGPGRGHKGPIAAYVAEHGCSRDTASRRLRAS